MAVEPLEMRAGTDTALGRVVKVFGLAAVERAESPTSAPHGTSRTAVNNAATSSVPGHHLTLRVSTQPRPIADIRLGELAALYRTLVHPVSGHRQAIAPPAVRQASAPATRLDASTPLSKAAQDRRLAATN